METKTAKFFPDSYQMLANGEKDCVKELIAETKKLATLIDFGCDCFEKEEQGCCRTCAHELGNGALNLTNIELFDSEYGFWRKGKGCILPVEDRPLTCLSFSCKPLSKEDHLIIDNMHSVLYDKVVYVKDIDGMSAKLQAMGINSYREFVTKAKIYTDDQKLLVWSGKIPVTTARRILSLRHKAVKQLSK